MSRMEAELREAPEAVGRQAEGLAAPLAELLARLARQPPRLVVTCARGSSAHAATFAKHLVERRLGLPVAAAAPSIASLYRRRLRLEGQLLLAISQSGGSDDLIETAKMARKAGALVAALVNVTDSPLAAACDIVLPIGAGPEESVAATKSFVASLCALLRWVARWTKDGEMERALDRLPERLAAASALDWGEACGALAGATSVLVLGRGPTLPIAREAALKLKEVCRLHAEAFSAAEFRHGPMALAGPGYPVLLLMPTDAAAAGLSHLAADLGEMGAAVFAAQPGAPRPGRLPVLAPQHPEADAICLAQSFYATAARLARLRGTEIDRPRHLEKVTRTR
ncbi:MAG TPA: SIS domain-containing protein [Stellaceae bacterium]|nr:SIS domain-containing protein [Stellaceae bacterium]